MEYKLSYGIFHWVVHFSLAFGFGYLMNANLSGFLAIFLATILIDLDHLSVLSKKGIFGYLKSLKFDIPRSYPLHKIYFLALSAFLGLITASNSFLFLIFIAIAIHMLWDLFEDVVIFRVGIKHWM